MPEIPRFERKMQNQLIGIFVEPAGWCKRGKTKTNKYVMMQLMLPDVTTLI